MAIKLVKDENEDKKRIEPFSYDLITDRDKKIVVAGINDYIIVETDDTIMIYPKSEEQNIKEVSKVAENRFAKG